MFYNKSEDSKTGKKLKYIIKDIKDNAGQLNRGVNISISGKVFIDSNRNGSIDPMAQGVDKVVIKLYTEDGKSTEYTTITGADGTYSLKNIPPVNYYLVVNNIPNDKIFIENVIVDPHITKTGISNRTINTVIENFNIPIGDNLESRGMQGITGPKGSDSDCATFYSMEFDCQTVLKGDYIQLGNRMSGNRYVIDYNNGTCFVKLNSGGVYFITLEGHANFIGDTSIEDYIGIQLKLNEYPLNQGLFYRKDNGTIYISTLVRVEPFKNNYISFQNTGTTDINVDNISLRIWRIS
ncbi:SdrD B-like domain-containing protein [Clostridium butyricum]|uniref:SdrD B-like domain-containing protein n=1 Tax=Clostridium butyricum TaxID=1492 RepID=UPI00346504EA